MEEKHVLKYRLLETTSEDPENPLYELMKAASPDSLGWSSIRFCSYPQEILLQFISPICLKQINILSHEKRISSLVEFYCYYPNDITEVLPNHKSLQFDKLGYIRMDNNLKTNYKAREYRKVYVETYCYYLKIVLHKNYVNKFNIFNQVSIINLEFMGSPIYMQVNDLILQEQLNFDIKDHEIDDLTQDKIKIMKNLLEESIKNEDFDEARKLKINIDKMKLFGKKLLDLENQKKHLLIIEDFDSAKILKMEIDRIKSKVKNIDKQLGEINHNSVILGINSNNINSSMELNKSIGIILNLNEDNKENIENTNKDKNNENAKESANDLINKSLIVENPKETSFNTSNDNHNIININIEKSILNKSLEKIEEKQAEESIPYEDQIIPALRKKSKGNLAIPPADSTNLNINLNISNIINPEDFLYAKGELEDLDPNILLSFEPFIKFIGEEGLKKLFSRHVLWKEEGLEDFTKKRNEIINEKNENINQLITLTMKLFNIFLGEKHPQISLRAMDVFESILILLQKLSSVSKKGEKFSYDFNITDNILIRIKEKLGDVNLKLRNKAIDLYCFMLKQSYCDYNNLLSELLEEEFRHIDSKKVLKSSKVISGKLTIFDNVFDEFNNSINEKRTDLNTFPLNIILNYTVENLSHSKSEIRKLARKILLKINQIFGFKKIEGALIKKSDEKELEKLTDKIPDVVELIKGIQFNKLKLLQQNSPRVRSGSAGSPGADKKRNLDKKYNNAGSNNKGPKNANNNNGNSKMIEKNEEAPNKDSNSKINNGDIKDFNTGGGEDEKDIKENKKMKAKQGEAQLNKIKHLICSYCGKSDKKFLTQANLDEHLSSECLLFGNCIKCKKNIEIRLLNNHMLSECANKNEFKVCRRCKEAIEVSEYEGHIKENICNPAKNINSCNRCPLCHKDVPPLDKGFVQHLVSDGCPKHSRK